MPTHAREARGRVRRLGRAAAAALVLLLGLGAAGVRAQAAGEPVRTPQSEDAARRAIGELRSPYCPGLMLEVCPSTQAEMLRDSIRMLAAQGMSSEALVEWMIANHGEEWRAVPKRRGLGFWAWALPPAALLLGAGVLTLRLRALRAARAEPAAAAAELSDSERAELAAALAAWEAAETEEEPA